MRLAALFILTLLQIGCAERQALSERHPENLRDGVTLYALHPNADPERSGPEASFHGYKILGRVDLTGTDRGAALWGYLQKESELPEGVIAGCFEPRHGLRVVRDGRVTDYVLCFACQQYDWYEGPPLRWAGKQELDTRWHGRFTRPLNEAGIELAD